ncbi:MAG: DNA polymerase III subunit delta [Actinobacteria bacterium]|nr:MAG: DNA polymerase III subunit delta [Actinomycetota bacterium]
MPGSAAVVLFWGEDEFLLRLAARERLRDRGMEPTEVDGAGWQGGETADLATPSLWGEQRALLVTGSHHLPEAGLREIQAYVTSPSPDALLVMTLVSRAKSAPPLAKRVRESGGEVRQVAMRRQDLPKWIVDRAKSRGLRLSGPAATTLMAAVGEDTAALDQATEQLAVAFAGKTVTPDDVRAQFQGLGEQRVWDLCDQALTGRLGEALVTLRGLLEAREDPLLILGGIAARLRELVRVRGLPARMPSAEAAKAAGIRFDWQVRRYRDQAGRFSEEGLASLHARVAEADRALKGGVAGDVLLPSLVAAMAGMPDAALDVPVRVSR